MSDQTMIDLREALNPDLIGVLPDGRYTMPKPHFEVVNAAARRFLALTETGPDYEAGYATALEWGVAVIPPAVEAIVDAALADYLTEEDR